MLNRSASLAMSTCILKALPGKLDIKRHSPCILCMLLLNSLVDDISVINYLVTKMVTEKKDRTRKLNSIHTEKISFSFGSPWTNS